MDLWAIKLIVFMNVTNIKPLANSKGGYVKMCYYAGDLNADLKY